MKHAEAEALKLVKFRCVGYIGTWTSGTSIEVAKLLSAESINRAMIGYSAGSPQLSSKQFSNYVRTNPGVQTKVKPLASETDQRSALVYFPLDCGIKSFTTF